MPLDKLGKGLAGFRCNDTEHSPGTIQEPRLAQRHVAAADDDAAAAFEVQESREIVHDGTIASAAASQKDG